MIKIPVLGAILAGIGLRSNAQAVMWDQSGNNYSTGRLSIGTIGIGKQFVVESSEYDHMASMVNKHSSGYGLDLKAQNDPLRIVPFNGGNNLFVVNGSGTVGVNVSVPYTTLHVAGGLTTTGISNLYHTSTARFDLENTAISLNFGYLSADYPMIQSSNKVLHEYIPCAQSVWR